MHYSDLSNIEISFLEACQRPIGSWHLTVQYPFIRCLHFKLYGGFEMAALDRSSACPQTVSHLPTPEPLEWKLMGYRQNILSPI